MIFEATRLITVVNGVLRRTIEDVELNGMCFMLNQGEGNNYFKTRHGNQIVMEH